MIWRKDILDAYQKETERREITASLASSINMKDETTQVHFMEGYSISEIENSLILIISLDKTRSQYASSICLIRSITAD